MHLIFLFFFTLSSVQASTISEKQLSYWYKLLHYRKTVLGTYVSEVDAEKFFSSSEGKMSPEEEFEASISILNSGNAQEFVCKFPLRYRWLKANTPNNWDYDTQSCSVYNSFKEKMDAKNLSLVFSSFYINNPGSTFGHTFIHVSRYKEFRTNELLDYAINFAAQDTKGDNAVMYMLKGLAGFYPGRFSVIPYYYKIREYNDHEFRDIWDYDLDLSQEQIDRVIDHAWELGESHFDYYYFTENCSYHILGLLNVAYDDVDILKDLPALYVLPIDTVKELQRLGLVKEKKIRVSAYGKLLKETEGLNQKELEKVKIIADDPSKVKSVFDLKDDVKSAKLLDASISALDYMKAMPILTNSKIETEQRETLLRLRAENSYISPDLQFNEKHMPAPDESHGSSRLGVSVGYRNQEGIFENLEWRAAQHDLLDPHHGQLKFAQVVMFETKLRLQTENYSQQSPVIDRFRLFDLKKYQASDFWNRSVSWDFGIGLDQNRSCPSRDCLNPIVTFGAGNSVNLSGDYVFSVLLGGNYTREKSYKYDSQINLGPKLNLLILKEHLAASFNAFYFFSSELFEVSNSKIVGGDIDLRFFLNRQLALFMNYGLFGNEKKSIDEAQIGIYIYH